MPLRVCGVAFYLVKGSMDFLIKKENKKASKYIECQVEYAINM